MVRGDPCGYVASGWTLMWELLSSRPDGSVMAFGIFFARREAGRDTKHMSGEDNQEDKLGLGQHFAIAVRTPAHFDRMAVMVRTNDKKEGAIHSE